jgi:hypothetical protein
MNFVEGIRKLTRPGLTVLLVGTLCAIMLKVIWSVEVPVLSAEVWAGVIGTFTGAVMMALAWWFASRDGNSTPV